MCSSLITCWTRSAAPDGAVWGLSCTVLARNNRAEFSLDKKMHCHAGKPMDRNLSCTLTGMINERKRMRKAAVALTLLLLGAGASAKASGVERLDTWTHLGPAPIYNGTTVVSGRVDIAVSDPTDANVMYVGTGAGAGLPLGGGGVWKTTNYLTTDPAGPTWVPLTDAFPSLSIFGKSLALYPSNPNILYAAASGPNGGILKTVDGGAHWEYLFSDLFSAALFSALVIDPTDSNTGSTWMNLTLAVATGSVATDVLIDPSNPLVLYSGLVNATDSTEDGVYKSVDGGESWQLLTNGVFNGTQVGEWIALAMAPSSPQTVYTTIFQRGNSSTTPMLQRFLTTDAGNTWSMLPLPPVANHKQDYRFWHVVLGVDPSFPNVIYANAAEPNFVASTDSGQTWRTLFTGSQFQD